jgi:L-seryl-tRNA(Ser) seleniumtransferase
MNQPPQDERSIRGMPPPKPTTGGGPGAAHAAAPRPGHFSFRRLLNATGVIIQPEFGGPPLPVLAQRTVAGVAAGWSTLGHDPALGRDAGQESGVDRWLMHLTGAPSALAVNSSAGAILLVLASLASERKVLVSRAEMAEAGRALDLPEIVTKSGARFVEVGTTHKTRVADYERAFERYSSVAAILRVPSRAAPIEGLTEGARPNELAVLARTHNVPLIEDLGNGGVVDLSRYGLEPRYSVAGSLASGASVVTCSGYLLLTGSQVGLILGEAEAISRMRRDPVMLAVRLDRLVQAALEATLAVHGDPEVAAKEIPALAMLALAAPLLRERAERLAAELSARVTGLQADLVESPAEHVRGELPTSRLAGPLVQLRHPDVCAEEIDRIARSGDPPVIGIVRDGRFVLDPRTLAETEIAVVATSFAAAWSKARS